MSYVHHSNLSMANAEADELTERYALWKMPAIVEPLRPDDRISIDCRCRSVRTKPHEAVRYTAWQSHCRSGMKLIANTPPDLVVLFLQSSGALELDDGRERHFLTSATGFVAAMPRIETLVFHENRSHLAIAWQKSMLVGVLSELLDAPVTGDLEITGKLDLTTPHGSRIARLSRLIWDYLDTNAGDSFSPAAPDLLVRALMLLVLQNVPHNYHERLTGPVSPAIPRKLKRAIEYMHANAASPMTVSEIAREAGTTVRSLQTAFQQFKDMTPSDYLRAIRLEGVRKALLSGRDVLSIADIARNWGFLHMGRFAAIYHQSFGEMPSETMRRQGRSN